MYSCYLTLCKNLVVRIIAPNIIQGLSNRVEVASLFFLKIFFRELQSIYLLLKSKSANAMSTRQCFTDFAILIKISSAMCYICLVNSFFQLLKKV